jgi:hypothetical protein
MIIFPIFLLINSLIKSSSSLNHSLDLFSLYEHWEIQGTGVLYYHQLLLLQQGLHQKHSLASSSTPFKGLGNWNMEFTLKSSCFKNNMAEFGVRFQSQRLQTQIAEKPISLLSD